MLLETRSNQKTRKNFMEKLYTIQMEFRKGEVDRESQRSRDVALQPTLPVPLPIQ